MVTVALLLGEGYLRYVPSEPSAGYARYRAPLRLPEVAVKPVRSSYIR